MNENAPMTRADLQTILDHVTQERRKTENYIDDQLSEIKRELKSVKDDVSMIASVFGFKRNSKGQLFRT